MKPTGPRELVGTFVVVGVLVNLLTRLSYASLPPLPASAGATLLVLAGLEAVLAYYLKRRIEHKPGTVPVEPLMAARAVLLARASAVGGAVMAGVWAGLLSYLLPRRGELVAAADDTTGAVVGLISAAALVAAGLWLQHCCRTPSDPDDQEPAQRR